ncbi:hypothetical protein HMPREF2634_02175 [Streptococcus sp. HMSC034B03]|uniref:DUF1642 domain-containing protein n=1 Tax=Streptococcus sp. HMSC034B03 TaxID=1715113 RepID=UPI0008A97C46|nr:DUF1642 domain-containing protein [Streptococcus sp. HMSC034B03]OHR61505.1 hypothetical protein HMPREF2634_02175 [Streptococcus sp. HMSC034B03]
MNKQEALKKLEGVSKTGCTRWVVYDEAKELIEQINEPERVKLTKTQEDYLLGFGDIKNEESEDWTVALYYIVRVGWGYLFTTAPGAGNDEISLNGDYYKKLSGNLDVDDLKILLIKALVNGYEVEKEKLYTVELPNPNGKSPFRKYGKDFEWAWQFAKEAE